MVVHWVPPESRGTVPRSVSRGLSQGLHGLRSAKVATKSRKGWSRLRGGRYSWGSYRPICLAGRRTARGQWLPVPLQLRNWCETVTLRVSGGGRGGGGRREGSPQQAGLLESGAGWRFLWFLRLQLLSVKSSSARMWASTVAVAGSFEQLKAWSRCLGGCGSKCCVGQAVVCSAYSLLGGRGTHATAAQICF